MPTGSSLVTPLRGDQLATAGTGEADLPGGGGGGGGGGVNGGGGRRSGGGHGGFLPGLALSEFGLFSL